MQKAYLGLGSNLGDKTGNVLRAIALISDRPEIHISDVSSLYETEPVGYLEQDTFVNCALELETTLTPYELLEVCQHVEQILKRKRDIRWGPRTIDVDILSYGTLILNDPRLTLPHPRMKERAFVLVPLNELDAQLDIDGETPAELLKRLCVKGIRKMDFGLRIANCEFENPKSEIQNFFPS